MKKTGSTAGHGRNVRRRKGAAPPHPSGVMIVVSQDGVAALSAGEEVAIGQLEAALADHNRLTPDRPAWKLVLPEGSSVRVQRGDRTEYPAVAALRELAVEDWDSVYRLFQGMEDAEDAEYEDWAEDVPACGQALLRGVEVLRAPSLGGRRMTALRELHFDLRGGFMRDVREAPGETPPALRVLHLYQEPRAVRLGHVLDELHLHRGPKDWHSILPATLLALALPEPPAARRLVLHGLSLFLEPLAPAERDALLDPARLELRGCPCIATNLPPPPAAASQGGDQGGDDEEALDLLRRALACVRVQDNAASLRVQDNVMRLDPALAAARMAHALRHLPAGVRQLSLAAATGLTADGVRQVLAAALEAVTTAPDAAGDAHHLELRLSWLTGNLEDQERADLRAHVERDVLPRAAGRLAVVLPDPHEAEEAEDAGAE